MSVSASAAKAALRVALRVRAEAGVALTDAVCPSDIAERRGADVWFTDIDSMEGMYWRGQRKILVPAFRPAGRQAFAVAHELGHHVFGHGTHIDEVIQSAGVRAIKARDEALVDAFAGYLLMPKAAVLHGFRARGWDPTRCEPAQVYTVAQWLGVGYEALITHMTYSLRILSPSAYTSLSRASLPRIRASLLPDATKDDLFIVDSRWLGRAVDMQVGDYLAAPLGAEFVGGCLEAVRREKYLVLRARAPGIGRVDETCSPWAAFVRVSRRNYIGRNRFRHLEEDNDGDD